MDYFYDKQLRKYIQQFIRIFSDFKVQVGFNDGGEPLLRTVPVNYGDQSRIVAHIVKKNSENTLNSVPFISLYVTDLSMAPERRTFQQDVSSAYITEKKYDHDLGEYIDEPGDRYEVKRYKPVPYDLFINVDVWTSNSNQKFELLEQLLVLFNPHINLTINDNPVDWSNLTYMEMTNLQWSGRSIPTGADDVIDVSTLQFKIPIYINPPVRVRRQRLIHTIINRLDAVNDDNLTLFNDKQSFESQFTSYIITTPSQFKVDLHDDRVTILNRQGGDADDDGNTLNWQDVIDMYGTFNPGFSQIRFRRTADIEDDSQDIIGILSFDDTDSQKMIVNLDPDTIPANTLGTIDAVINPKENYPGDGVLPAAALNQRYLVTEVIYTNSPWGTDANPNDIITFNGTSWTVSFDSENSNSIETVFDENTNDQLEWDVSVWRKSYEGVYAPGYWRLYL